MSNKPQNVIQHIHLWATPEHEAVEAGRLDVCLLADGEAVVWDMDRDELWKAVDPYPDINLGWTWDEAVAEARFLADCRADLSRERWVRVMCDYSADPLWHQEGCMADIDDLPIPIGIRDRLRRWRDDYEEHDGWAEWLHNRPVDPVAFRRFGIEGLAIALAIKTALPSWTVIYHDEWRHDQQPDAPRDVWEYEVTV